MYNNQCGTLLAIVQTAILFGISIAPAVGQDDDTDPSLDSRLEAFEAPELALYIEASGLVTGRNNFVSTTPDDDGNLLLQAQPLQYANPITMTGTLACDVKFFGQAQVLGTGSGMLVGPDLFLTARHILWSQQQGQYLLGSQMIVFDWALESDDDPLALFDGDFVTVPASAVYSLTEVVADHPPEDWVLVRLDREVLDRRPIKLSATEPPDDRFPVVTIGYPDRIPLKIAPGRRLSFAVPNGSTAWYSCIAERGSSGSMMLNRDGGRVFGVVSRGGGAYLAADPDGVPACECYQSGQCDSYRRWYTPEPGARGPQTAPLVERGDVPPTGIEFVGPSFVDSYGPPAGPYNPIPGVLTLKDHSTRWASTVSLTSEPLSGLMDGGLMHPIEVRERLAPGATLNVPVSTMTPILGLPAVGKVRTFHFWMEDVGFQTRDMLNYRVHMGGNGFEFLGGEPFVGDGPGAPSGSTRLVSIANRWSIPQTIRVTPGEDWITLNKLPGQIEFELPPYADDMEVQLELEVDPDNQLAAGVYETSVLFQTIWNETVTHTETLLTRVDVGRLHRPAPGLPVSFTVPAGGAEVFFPLLVEDIASISDLDLRLRVTTPTAGNFRDTEILLESPAGTRVRVLHGFRGVSGGVLDILADDETDPLPRPDKLSAFDGEPMFGQWRLVFRKVEGDTPREVNLEELVLRFTPATPVWFFEG